MRRRLFQVLSPVVLATILPWTGFAQVGPTAAKNLDAAVRGFVYVEPFEIRTEFVVRPGMTGLGAGLDGAENLDGAAQEQAIDDFRGRLAEACKVDADGVPLAFELDKIQFITIDPVKGPLPDEREVIPVAEARIAAVFSCAREDYPGKLQIEWNLFPAGDDTTKEVPVEVEALSGRSIFSESLTFTPDNRLQGWLLPEVAPAPTLVEIAAVAPADRTVSTILAAVLLLGGVALIAAALIRRPANRLALLGAGALFFALAAASYFLTGSDSGSDEPGEEEGTMLVENLLKNIYHAFAFRDESTIFDTLAVSVEGPLLEKLYLDIRRGLELEESGGPRVKVLRVAMIECEMQRAPGGEGLKADVAWACMGNVSHWGHVHPRRNQYRGELFIEPIDGTWKVTEVKILEEERM